MCLLPLTHEATLYSLQVSGDVRAVFYDKNGGRLFYICFNTFFISNSILQVSCLGPCNILSVVSTQFFMVTVVFECLL
jgi:hypothetical protein